jgi:hypothetical protein
MRAMPPSAVQEQGDKLMSVMEHAKKVRSPTLKAEAISVAWHSCGCLAWPLVPPLGHLPSAIPGGGPKWHGLPARLRGQHACAAAR